MKRQEIFDFAAAKLLEQGVRSSLPGIACAYRGEKGCRCAIGWLIPDDRYRSTFEGRAVTSYPMSARGGGKPIRAAIDPVYEVNPDHSEHTAFLGALQKIHDLKYPADWRGALSDFADDYNLDKSVLNEEENVS